MGFQKRSRGDEVTTKARAKELVNMEKRCEDCYFFSDFPRTKGYSHYWCRKYQKLPQYYKKEKCQCPGWIMEEDAKTKEEEVRIANKDW